MCAEMHALREISETSGAILCVAFDGQHMKGSLFYFIAPPPALIQPCVFIHAGVIMKFLNREEL